MMDGKERTVLKHVYASSFLRYHPRQTLTTSTTPHVALSFPSYPTHRAPFLQNFPHMATTWTTTATESITDESGEDAIQANSAMLIACLVSQMSSRDRQQINVLNICRATTSLLESGTPHVRGRVAQSVALLATL